MGPKLHRVYALSSPNNQSRGRRIIPSMARTPSKANKFIETFSK
jgi:hypothetical protein